MGEGVRTAVHVLALWRGILGEQEGGRCCVEDRDAVEYGSDGADEGGNAVEETTDDWEQLGCCVGVRGS